ncbi:hypothetical protein AGMMS50293_24870 [Spirochaetia bacterium]|nr:hypothetical protein AGMMS50293_24870 [Spirochaetia bacterium]
MKIHKVLFLAAGFLLLGLAVAGIVLPVLPATPFLLGAAFCFMKSSERLYAWLINNRFLGPRLERIRSGKGLTLKEKLIIYFTACAFIVPIIVLTHSPHLRIFLVVLLAVKAFVFIRMKTAQADV